jgi:hypothetical protein
VSSANAGSATHSATAATVQALGQRACRHRSRAERDRRRNNKYYLTHEGSSPFCNMRDDADALQQN